MHISRIHSTVLISQQDNKRNEIKRILQSTIPGQMLVPSVSNVKNHDSRPQNSLIHGGQTHKVTFSLCYREQCGRDAN